MCTAACVRRHSPMPHGLSTPCNEKEFHVSHSGARSCGLSTSPLMSAGDATCAKPAWLPCSLQVLPGKGDRPSGYCHIRFTLECHATCWPPATATKVCRDPPLGAALQMMLADQPIGSIELAASRMSASDPFVLRLLKV